MATDAFDLLAETLVRGSEQSYVSYLTERFLDMLDEAVTNPDRFQVLASRAKTAAMSAWDRFRGKVTKETESAFLKAVSGEDELLVSSLARAYGYDRSLTTRANNEANEAARGMSEVMRRQNVALADDVADAWYKVTSDAVTGTVMGKSYREVMEDAVSRLSDAGLETIDYRSGARTTIDAATRRHVVSQANQARADLTNRRCDEWGCDLVMVSAHFGARPSHAEWQGRIYSRSGKDRRYPSLDEGTGYHGTGPYGALGDRLCGVNCLHSMTPYVPGHGQLPSTDFSEQEGQVGMTSDEYYAATQKQRGMERKVRLLKRRVALGQERGLDMTADRYRLGRAQADLRAHCATNGLRRDYERERAYGVSRQPTGLGRVDFNAPRWQGQYPNPTAANNSTGRKVGWDSETRESGITKKAFSLDGAKVDASYIASDEYSRKFSGLTGNDEADNEILKLARASLTHRSGTSGEDLHLVSIVDGREKGGNTSSKTPPGVDENDSVSNAVADNPPNTLFAIHNHPNNVPPTGSDLVTSGYRHYAGAVVVLHDGTVYYYRHGDVPFFAEMFDNRVQSFENKGLSEADAIEASLKEFEGRYGITWRRL